MDIKSLSDRLKANICKVITGKDEVIEKIIIAALCSGHVLLEDIPGTGKTTIINATKQSTETTNKIKEILGTGIISTSTANTETDLKIMIGKDYK